MKFQAIPTLLAIVSIVNAHRFEAHRVHHKRQGQPQGTVSGSSSSSSQAGAPQQTTSSSAAAAPPPPPGQTSTSVPAAGVPSGTTTTSTSAAPVNTGPPPLDPGTGVPPLSSISFGMATQAPLSVSSTYAAGATPPVSGAPVLPTPFVFSQGSWPAQDITPPTDSPEVQEWMKELEGYYIPNIPPTVDGSCVNDTSAATNAATNGWWTCGGYTRPTDIVACPDKLTWGVSFDDGPSQYTQKLLNFLGQNQISATFFVVGSRVIERPAVLVEEYMAGHEISVHTWSHRHLTSLSNEGVVAELGWTRKAIREVLGVSPTTMRPPYGDIDDRVRAIAMAMGMIPIIWTATPTAGKFDTNDWQVAGGLMTAPQQMATFDSILGNATTIDTGFIVLQHDLFEITVDLAVGYTLPAAMQHNPAFKLESIGRCAKIPESNLYIESNTNKTFPYSNTTSNVMGEGSSGSSGSGSGSGSGASSALGNTTPILAVLLASTFAIMLGITI